MQINTWEDLLEKLAHVKEEKLLPGLRVGPMVVAIYSGGLDSILQPLIDSHGSHINAYNQAYKDVIKVTGSTAKLPKKNKNDFIGLDEVSNDAQLAAWRNQNSPIGVFPFLNTMKSELEILGFKYDENRHNYRKSDPVKNTLDIATDEWEKLYSFIGSSYWDQIQSRNFRFHVVGVTTSVEVRKFSNNTKEMMKLSFFTGRESVSDVILWPDWGQDRIDAFLKMIIKPGEIFLFEAVPTFKNGRKGGRLVGAKKIGDMG